MNPIVAELESLRRVYEENSQSSASLDEAIERGWTKDELEKREKISREKILTAQAVAKLTGLIGDLQRQRSTAVVEWIALHIETCLTMLREDVLNKHEKAGIRSICLSDLLQAVAKQLQPGRRLFTVNNFYLTDYYAVYESVTARRYA